MVPRNEGDRYCLRADSKSTQRSSVIVPKPLSALSAWKPCQKKQLFREHSIKKGKGGDGDSEVLK